MHMMLAQAAATQEFALSEPESKALAESVRGVLAFYPTSVIDPKTIAWVNLAICAGGIYGTRILAIRARKRRKEREEKQQPQNVVPIGGTPLNSPIPPVWKGKGMPPGQ